MKKILLIITMCFFCISCGVKDNPEYESLIKYNKNTYLI
jgi:hypothetical protein